MSTKLTDVRGGSARAEGSDGAEPGQAVQNYTELKVYKLAFESAMRIFELSKSWPREEKYTLTDQIRRSSLSASSNIAEAWRKRPYPAHFLSRLSDADTGAG